MSDGITDMKAEQERIINAFDYLLHLHNCEMEGMLSSQPTADQWFDAVEEAERQLIELKEMFKY